MKILDGYILDDYQSMFYILTTNPLMLHAERILMLMLFLFLPYLDLNLLKVIYIFIIFKLIAFSHPMHV